jgi:hypothetical protein
MARGSGPQHEAVWVDPARPGLTEAESAVSGADIGGALSLLAAGLRGRCLWGQVQCWPRDGEAKLEAGAAAAGWVGASQLTVVGVG